MKALRLLIAAALAFGPLTSCIFKEPVFTTGFVRADNSWLGVWATDGEGDPRNVELAVFLPLDESRYVLHYPSNDKDNFYFEARLLRVRDRDVMQLRVLGTMKGGAAKSDDDTCTLLWLEKKSPGVLSVRALKGGEEASKRGAAGTRKLLEDPASDWTSAFGDAMEFKRLKNQ